MEVEGRQFCYQWCASKKGCPNPCPWGRMRLCEFCLKPHRIIGCNHHKNFEHPNVSGPNDAEFAPKGKGKGKGKDGNRQKRGNAKGEWKQDTTTGRWYK